MKIVFTQSAWQDYLWFQEHGRHLLKRLNDLIRDAQRSPFRGIGKPESLKGELSGYWSRRINAEHRFVYSVRVWPVDAAAEVVKQCKGLTAHHLRQKYAVLRRMPSLWTRSYFASTAGNVSAEILQRYIAAQKGV